MSRAASKRLNLVSAWGAVSVAANPARPHSRERRSQKAGPAEQGKAIARRCMRVAVCMTAIWLWLAGGVSALPVGRVLEQVSPEFKGGYGANSITAVGPDGNAIGFTSLGAFAGALGNPVGSGYLARRGPTGWSTVSLEVPSSIAPYSSNLGPDDYSADFESSLNLAFPGPNRGQAEQEGTEAEFVLRDFDGPVGVSGFAVIPPLIKFPEGTRAAFAIYVGANDALSRLFFVSQIRLLPEAPHVAVLYEVNSEQEALSLVGRDNKGQALGHDCRTGLGNEVLEPNSQVSGSVSADGEVAVFTAVGSSCGGQLFARLDGQRTVELSRPLDEACAEVPCPGAATRGALGEIRFAGASEDGSRVFFTTPAQLVAGDKDKTVDLYEAQLGCPAASEGSCGVAEWVVRGLAELSGGSGGAEVQGVVAVAPDGAHVYFVARGVLTAAPNRMGQAARPGADNLYVLGGSPGEETTTFVTDLCSGLEQSGTVSSPTCPLANNDAALWTGSGREAQLAQAGSVLVFSSYGQLTSDDTDSAKDLFRFDLGSGSLVRVSGGVDGFDSNGNRNGFNATMQENNGGVATAELRARLSTRAVSEDGQRIAFTSSEALSPVISSGVENVYEWDDGVVAAVTTSGGRDPLITSSGDDLFFVSDAGLLAGDDDGAPDVYDARIGGGFPAAPVERQECSGDACQGSLTHPAPLLVPGSVPQESGGNLAPPAAAKPKSKPPAKASRCTKGRKPSHGRCVKPRRKSPKKHGKTKTSRRSR